MAYDLEHRVGILEATVRSEAEQRAKMSKDIGKLGMTVDTHFSTQRHLIQALQDTQSDHTSTLREIRETVSRMAPKVDAIETRVVGLGTHMGFLETRVGDIDEKIDTVSQRLDSKIDTVSQRLDEKFTHLDGKIDTVSQRLDEKFTHLDGKIDTVSQRLDEKFTHLDGKIDAVIGLLRDGRK